MLTGSMTTEGRLCGAAASRGHSYVGITKIRLGAMLAATLVLCALGNAYAQVTTFTYQGYLEQDGSPATGLYDLRFDIWNSAAAGSKIGSSINHLNESVSNGLFTVTLDFGTAPFDGSDRWLQISVQTNGSGYTALSPRTPITATPYAIRAVGADNVPAGSIGSVQIANNSITATDLAPDAVGTSELADDSVGSTELQDSIDLGDTSTSGELHVYRNATGTPGISIWGASSMLSTFGDDGAESARIHGNGWGYLNLYGSGETHALQAVLSANAAGGGYLSLSGSNGLSRASLRGYNSGGELRLYADDGSTGAILHGDSFDAGALSLYNDAGSRRVFLDGANADGAGELTIDEADSSVAIRLTGTAGDGGEAYLYESDGSAAIEMFGGSGGDIYVNDSSAQTAIQLSANPSLGGYQYLYNRDGDRTVYLDGDSGYAGRVIIGNTNGLTRIALDGYGTGGGGEIIIDEDDGSEAVRMYGSSGGKIYVRDGSGQTAVIVGGTSSFGGYQYLYNGNGAATIFLDGDSGGGAYANFRNSAGSNRVIIDGDSTDNGGGISVYDGDGHETVEILGAEGTGQGGQIVLRDSAGVGTIYLDGDYGGDGRVTTEELEITGGSDLSEQFDVFGAAPEELPGSVVCIDPENPGKLVLSSVAYDRTVAGIVSGAGGVKPGMLMSQAGSEADGEHPVALSGRVYCRVDADRGAVQPGDLITTSDVPGHGMRVTDYDRARGAIIGKAMTGLQSGRGLVLVLVTLQ